MLQTFVWSLFNIDTAPLPPETDHTIVFHPVPDLFDL
jgi:hypothetical protein